MKRLAALFSVLVVVIAAALGLHALHVLKAPQPQATNFNPRPLNDAEQTVFLKLVCSQAGGPLEGYAHQCASLIGYPSSDYGGAGLGIGITLQSVVYGHLTNDTEDEAYVTYEGSFEPHATNYGGGILFTGGPGKWALQGWYPGGQADQCVVLTPTGKARFVCLSNWEGQGESVSALALLNLPPPQGERPFLLNADDLRETMTPNANCQFLKAGQNVLLNIASLTPAAGGARAKIAYVKADDAQKACLANQFANAPVSTTTLTLLWQNGHMHITPTMNFVANHD